MENLALTKSQTNQNVKSNIINNRVNSLGNKTNEVSNKENKIPNNFPTDKKKFKRSFTEFENYLNEVRKSIQHELELIANIYSFLQINDFSYLEKFGELLRDLKCIDFSSLVPVCINREGSMILEDTKFWIVYIMYNKIYNQNFTPIDLTTLINSLLDNSSDQVRLILKFYYDLLDSYPREVLLRSFPNSIDAIKERDYKQLLSNKMILSILEQTKHNVNSSPHKKFFSSLKVYKIHMMISSDRSIIQERAAKLTCEKQSEFIYGRSNFNNLCINLSSQFSLDGIPRFPSLLKNYSANSNNQKVTTQRISLQSRPDLLYSLSQNVNNERYDYTDIPMFNNNEINNIHIETKVDEFEEFRSKLDPSIEEKIEKSKILKETNDQPKAKQPVSKITKNKRSCSNISKSNRERSKSNRSAKKDKKDKKDKKNKVNTIIKK
jgi:hypothetical protein